MLNGVQLCLADGRRTPLLFQGHGCRPRPGGGGLLASGPVTGPCCSPYQLGVPPPPLPTKNPQCLKRLFDHRGLGGAELQLSAGASLSNREILAVCGPRTEDHFSVSPPVAAVQPDQPPQYRLPSENTAWTGRS
jgi:hypothetical protein